VEFLVAPQLPLVSPGQYLVSPTLWVVSPARSFVSPTLAVVSTGRDLVSPRCSVVSPAGSFVSPAPAVVSPSTGFVSTRCRRTPAGPTRGASGRGCWAAPPPTPRSRSSPPTRGSAAPCGGWASRGPS